MNNNSSLHNPQIQNAPFENDDDFLDQIFTATSPPSQLPSDSRGFYSFTAGVGPFAEDSSADHITMMPLSLGTESRRNDGVNGSIQNLYDGFAAGTLHGGVAQPQSVSSQHHQFQNQAVQAQSQASVSTTPPAQIRPKVRARRGQATDPHSIAERLRRERIAERMKALQELVPNANKTDKASMLDEIIDYVKFLQLQVKVLSMSRLGGAAAAAPLVSEGGVDCGQASGTHAPSTNGNNLPENQVVKMMEEDMGSAMQYLQGKGLCLMPISLATAISTATCPSRNPTITVNGGGHGRGVDGPASPNASVISVQSTTVANGNAVENAFSTP